MGGIELSVPVQEVTLAVSKGDFESVIRYEGTDALGHLANNMRNLTATITEIITDVETSMPNLDEAEGEQQNSNPFMPRPRNRNRNQQQQPKK